MEFERTFGDDEVREAAPSLDEAIFGRTQIVEAQQYYGHVLYKFFGWYYNIKSIYNIQTILNLIMIFLTFVALNQSLCVELGGLLVLVGLREYQSVLNLKRLTVLCPWPYKYGQTILISLDILLFLYNHHFISKIANNFYSVSITCTVLSSHFVLFFAATKYTERLARCVGTSSMFFCLHTSRKGECDDCTCMVCLEGFHNRRVFTLTCNHLLHEQCLLTMFERSLNFCPLCKLKFL